MTRVLRFVLFVAVASFLVPTGIAATGPDMSSAAIVVEENQSIDSIEGFAGTFVVKGEVKGNVSGAAGSIHITETGRVGGTIDAAAGTVRIEGSVGDVRVVGGTVELTETGHVNGSFDVGGGYVSINGMIEGDARVSADTLTVGSQADIAGDLRYAAETFNRDPDARVAGDVIEDESLEKQLDLSFDLPSLPSWVGGSYTVLASFLFGLLLLGAFPRFSDRIAGTIRKDALRSAGIGALALIGIPVASVIVILTIVGLPLGLLGLVVFLIAVWTSMVYAQYAIGEWLMEQASYDNRFVALLAGLIVVAAATRAPFVGGLIELAVLLPGFGALVITLIKMYNGR